MTEDQNVPERCFARVPLMSEPPKIPLVAAFARQLFIAEMGHTGMSWDDYARGDEDTEYHGTARRFLEGWYVSEDKVVVLDAWNDEMWVTGRAG